MQYLLVARNNLLHFDISNLNDDVDCRFFAVLVSNTILDNEWATALPEGV